jgi:hypothetical protein
MNSYWALCFYHGICGVLIWCAFFVGNWFIPDFRHSDFAFILFAVLFFTVGLPYIAYPKQLFDLFQSNGSLRFNRTPLHKILTSPSHVRLLGVALCFVGVLMILLNIISVTIKNSF